VEVMAVVVVAEVGVATAAAEIATTIVSNANLVGNTSSDE